ncbi:S-adenosyl-L-methionine-dependent methyltransferase [Clathrospora elynae]|uniref:S-adenosyl-L-methionine-dependent methyltransferase n=1 Tax=Clathrospora elynae TaxID=706981 RepID=A0A6A5T3N6_9PLEO|nr:S-adenosyl-L-methionine-dependent methyltransferase [Clathrospora elynae]
MEAARNQIRDLHGKANARQRQKIHEQLRDLQKDLYSDWDITGAAPNLLTHVLRSMASFGLIAETAKDTFEANRTTRVFANPHVVGAAPHISWIHLPVAQDLPFHQAMNTKLTPFEWMKQDSMQMKALGHIMVLDAVDSWVSSYPVEKEVGDFRPSNDSALLVDIGGGFGQHSVAFKKKYPELTSRICVQEIHSTLAHAPKVDGVEFEVHDFFTTQTFHGAKFYYLRHIMHDCIILAMGLESRILIDEVVLPETKMMAYLGGIERSKENWESLLKRAGLKIVDVHLYDEKRVHSVIAVVPK